MENVNIPKFVLDDIPLFKSITSDIFPDIQLAEDSSILKQSLIETCR